MRRRKTPLMKYIDRFAWFQLTKKNIFYPEVGNLRSSVSSLSSSDLISRFIDMLSCVDSKSLKFPNDSAQWLPYQLIIKKSGIENAGLGVHLRGEIDKGSIVACYPGTVYQPGDPLFLASIRNAYIIRCFDGLFVDGKHFGLSASVFRSMNRFHCSNSGQTIADRSWLKYPSNVVRSPLAVGQIINNATQTIPANGIKIL